MPADLLFEIGSEEIPAKMLARQLAELPALVETALSGARLVHKGVRALGTPRRLAVLVKQLADRQPDIDQEIVGPPASAAFAADGSVTRTGEGFAAKNGVDPRSLQQREVPGKKGLYTVAVKSVVGKETRALLPEILVEEIAKKIKWPKSQRWGWGETVYVRPVQWLVALFGGEVIPLSWAGLVATRASRGHRFLAPGPVEISAPDKYVETLKHANVVVDPEARRIAVQAELSRLETETNLRVRRDDALLDEVIHLGEYPKGVSGEFDPAFLEVPEEVIVTAMRTHQRYFAMEKPDGTLANRFATMMATIVRDPAVVAKGNEKVLAARLADAQFFFREDRKRTFDDWNTKLDAVVFQAKLGDEAKTIGQKVRRITAIVESYGSHGIDVAVARRAARLCKADLASSAVGEFPELQGTMGRHYARLAGEPERVAHAIEQHWWPKGQGAALPESREAALIAIADRIDTLVGCFATGLIPTGGADPLGLRRAAIGVLSILLDRGGDGARANDHIGRHVESFVADAEAAYGGAVKLSDDARAQLFEFFKSRLKAMLVDDEHIDVQAVDVALGGTWGDPTDVRRRARHLANVPHDTRAAFKRIANILDDARKKSFGNQAQPDAAKFTSPVEHALWDAYSSRRASIEQSMRDGEYAGAFRALAELGPALAAFFDKGGVMVMDPDAVLRENRLALLRTIYDQFVQIGDFRKLGGAQ